MTTFFEDARGDIDKRGPSLPLEVSSRADHGTSEGTRDRPPHRMLSTYLTVWSRSKVCNESRACWAKLPYLSQFKQPDGYERWVRHQSMRPRTNMADQHCVNLPVLTIATDSVARFEARSSAGATVERVRH